MAEKKMGKFLGSKNLFLMMFVLSLIIATPIMLFKVISDAISPIGQTPSTITVGPIYEGMSAGHQLGRVGGMYADPKSLGMLRGEEWAERGTIYIQPGSVASTAGIRLGMAAFEGLPHPIGAVDDSYFADALFIGDSRTVGLQYYGNITNATYFASVGLSVYGVFTNEVEVPGIGVVNLETLLTQHQYGKIYIMLGINELGYDFDSTFAEYQAAVQRIQVLQPEAIVYVQANLGVTANKSNSDATFNNGNIRALNERLSTLANGREVIYLNANPHFMDETQSLRAESSGDGIHLYAKYYPEWCSWLRNNAAIPRVINPPQVAETIVEEKIVPAT